MGVFDKLVRKEESETPGVQSSLRVFCRMDIGVYRDPHGKYRYFVLELQRNMCLLGLQWMNGHRNVLAAVLNSICTKFREEPGAQGPDELSFTSEAE